MKRNLYRILIKKVEDGSKIDWDILAPTKEEALEYATQSYRNYGQEYEILNIEEEVIDFNKEMVDTYGVTRYFAEGTRKIYNFNNSKKKITYNAMCLTILDDSKVENPFYSDYIEEGTVDNIEDKLEAWNNPVRLMYALWVNFNQTRNDPDKKLWNKVIEYIKNHEEEFFTKKGDWKQRIRAVKNRMELEIVDAEKVE